jgi:two-component system secretion sensor histidine kinase SsrA
MKKPWQNALLWRLIIALGCAISLFWLMSESVLLYSRYTTAKNTLNNELTVELQAAVNVESNHYLQAERRLKTLADLWQSMPTGTQLQLDTPHALFIPFANAIIDEQQRQKAMRAVELFGNNSETENEAAYIILPNQGMVLYKTAQSTFDGLGQRLKIMLSKGEFAANRQFHWGPAFWNVNRKLYVPLSVNTGETGVIIGMNVEVWRMPLLNHELRDAISFAVLDQNDHFLPVATIEKAIPASEVPATALAQCHAENPIEIDGFYFVCRYFQGPSWHVLARYPEKSVTLKAVERQLWTLPPLLAILLLLLAMIYWVLRTQIGNPLQNLVNAIDHYRHLDWSQPLPENRSDELGRIAKSYNQLLAVIRENYQMLDRRVKERTRALNEAKHLAEQSSKLKSEHIASISHEIRTPMNSIVGALSLLLRSRLTAEQRELIETANTSSDYLLSIINNLLDYNQIETGQTELPYESVELLPLLDKVVTTVHLRAEEKGLVFSTQVAANIPLGMKMSRIRVKQIIINLLGNAIKFTEKGYVSLQAERRGDRLAIAVSDSGPGIPLEQQQNIFLPFIQISEHTGGNGLGLTISSMLAQSMGGEIQLTSQPGKGSCFSLLLPIEQSTGDFECFAGTLAAPAALHPQLQLWGLTPVVGENPALSSPSLLYLPGRLWRALTNILYGKEYEEEATTALAVSPWSLKILVVDDVAANRDIVGKILRDLGHLVDMASSGEEALQFGRQSVYDMVLMDLRMPGMDGFTAAQRWREADSGILDEETPIIALTADALSTERERVKASGMNDYLSKPLRMEKLMAVIEQVVMQQLTRGVELTPNASLQKSLLEPLLDEELQQKIVITFHGFAENIDNAWQDRQRETLLEVLHAVKGCAGLCHYHDIYADTEQLEGEIKHGEWPSQARIQALVNQLINRPVL